MSQQERMTQLEALAHDVEDRLTNLREVKGENFANSVSVTMQIYSLMRMALECDAPSELHHSLIVSMYSRLNQSVFECMKLPKEEREEAAQFARSIMESINQHARRAFKQEP